METATQKKRRLAAVKKRNQFCTAIWKQWLASEGDQELTLDPTSYPKGMHIMVRMGTGFSIGAGRVQREIQRTFTAGKPTKVPKVLAAEFLKTKGIVDFIQDEPDSILDSEVIV